jgi:uncharacterized protein (UPF0305 family)
MSDLVTEDELARARTDPAFRQQFLAQNMDRLLEALNKMRQAGDQNVETTRQLREGADLAVQLADRLQAQDLRPHTTEVSR